jgi:hypothetical protein
MFEDLTDPGAQPPGAGRPAFGLDVLEPEHSSPAPDTRRWYRRMSRAKLTASIAAGVVLLGAGAAVAHSTWVAGPAECAMAVAGTDAYLEAVGPDAIASCHEFGQDTGSVLQVAKVIPAGVVAACHGWLGANEITVWAGPSVATDRVCQFLTRL